MDVDEPASDTVKLRFVVPLCPSTIVASAIESAGTTVTTNLSDAWPPVPSSTVTVIVAAPVWFGAGVSVSVREVPPALTTSPAFGTTV